MNRSLRQRPGRCYAECIPSGSSNWQGSGGVASHNDGLHIIEVTGYSLGGHLASAFNLMYPGDAARTVTFNGAGIGTFDIDATPLKGLVSLFAELSTQDYSSQIGNNELRELYGRLRSTSDAGQAPNSADKAALATFTHHKRMYEERAES